MNLPRTGCTYRTCRCCKAKMLISMMGYYEITADKNGNTVYVTPRDRIEDDIIIESKDDDPIEANLCWQVCYSCLYHRPDMVATIIDKYNKAVSSRNCR